MPRSARIDIPGLLQHVIVRGVNRCDIFIDDRDRRRFLERMSLLLRETGTDCLAWSLMTNHVHLLLCPRHTRLAPFMRRLLTGYAVGFNLRHHRSGHLFQNRYKSLVCEEDSYLLELVRYIHLNPLRAGLVAELDQLDGFPWSGHAVLLGRSVLEGQRTDDVLLLFSKDRTEAQRLYRSFVADGVAAGRRPELVGAPRKPETDPDAVATERGHDPRILGGSDFIQSLQVRPGLESRGLSGLGIGEIVERVCRHFGVDPAQIRKRSRTARLAEIRGVICYLAVRETGHNGAEVARHLNLGRAGVSHAASRGTLIVKRLPQLLRLLDN